MCNRICFAGHYDVYLCLMNIYLDDGRDWRQHEVTLSKLIENKTPKIALSPEIEPYFNDFIAILEENKDMFHVEHDQNK